MHHAVDTVCPLHCPLVGGQQFGIVISLMSTSVFSDASVSPEVMFKYP